MTAPDPATDPYSWQEFFLATMSNEGYRCSTETHIGRMSGSAIRAVREMTVSVEPCLFCHISRCRRDVYGRCLNCGAPDGEVP